jgi:hypothetical protein
MRIAACAAAALSLVGQPAFEMASVKLNKQGSSALSRAATIEQVEKPSGN